MILAYCLITWKLKRQTGSVVSADSIDGLYQRGVQAGALGGKFLGAGGGEFLLFYIRIYIPFEYETNGTQVIHYSPKKYVPRGEEYHNGWKRG